MEEWEAEHQRWRDEEREFKRLRSEIERAFPMRRKQASHWMADLWQRSKLQSAADLRKALEELYSKSTATKGEMQDICVALGIDPATPRIAQLKRYIAHLESELAKAQTELAALDTSPRP